MRAFTLSNYRANKFHRIAKTTINSVARIVRRPMPFTPRPHIECHAFRVIFLEPCFRGVGVRKHLGPQLYRRGAKVAVRGVSRGLRVLIDMKNAHDAR
jgi:hypothetical protein